ncbi:MAG: IPT/TIG domain-containing protein [Patescibacteria group bacterium]
MDQIIINTNQSSKRLIILVSILTSLSVTLVFNVLTYGLPIRAVVLTPTITSILPNSTSVGNSNVTITITGTGFTNGSMVKLRTGITTLMPLSTDTNNNMGGTQITATLLASQRVVGKTFKIVVENNPGAVRSNEVTFTVNNPVPTLTSLSQGIVEADTPVFVLGLNGTNFIPLGVEGASKVLAKFRPGGQTFFQATPYFLSTATTNASTSTLLNVPIAGDLLVAGRVFTFKVNNPAPGGGTTNELTLTVIAVIPP